MNTDDERGMDDNILPGPTVLRVLRLGLETAPPPLSLLPLLSIAAPFARLYYLPVLVVTPIYLLFAGRWVRDSLANDPKAWAWLAEHGPIRWTRTLKWGPGRKVTAPGDGRFIVNWKRPALIWMLLLPFNCIAMFLGAAASGVVATQPLVLSAMWTAVSLIYPTTGSLART